MNRLIVSFVAGLLFALGLGISAMTDPNKVLGFLDIGGSWDPSLAFVMVGAIGTYALPAWYVKGRGKPFFDSALHLAPFTEVDRRLVGGAVIFGVGWGLGGFCPGPAVVASAAGMGSALWFTGGMLGGMVLYQQWPEQWTLLSAMKEEPTPG